MNLLNSCISSLIRLEPVTVDAHQRQTHLARWAALVSHGICRTHPHRGTRSKQFQPRDYFGFNQFGGKFAICFLWSFMCPEHERRVRDMVKLLVPGWRMHCSRNGLFCMILSARAPSASELDFRKRPIKEVRSGSGHRLCDCLTWPTGGGR
jgi:hypothetical protein